jgi:hypothetical protein
MIRDKRVFCYQLIEVCAKTAIMFPSLLRLLMFYKIDLERLSHFCVSLIVNLGLICPN